jgi:serine/threonine protein kinase
MRMETHVNAEGSEADPVVSTPRLLPVVPTSRAFLAEQIRIGRYDLIYRLGSGGMAAVFVGRLAGLAGFERVVSVKVIHHHLADSKKFINMFLDEARMAASIHHPNVVEIHEVGCDRGTYFMVGEFVHGPDLGRLLRSLEDNGKPLAPQYAAYIAEQVCLGLHAAHETCDKDGNPLNLIHRDVSPNNVLISYNGFVKLIDFGVAWARNKLAHTESGALKGKIGYISPEQILGHAVDRRGDIFSVGVLLYVMSTLSHPFPGKSDAERLNKIISGQIQPPSEVRPDVNPGIERIILKALALSPNDRYRSAQEMAEDLRAFVASLQETVKPEDLGKLISSQFEKEKPVHEASLKAYRAARGDSLLYSEGFTHEPAATDIGSPPTGTPVSFSEPQRPKIKVAVVFTLVLSAAAVIVSLFWLLSGSSNRTNSESENGIDSKKTNAASMTNVAHPGVQPKNSDKIRQDSKKTTSPSPAIPTNDLRRKTDDSEQDGQPKGQDDSSKRKKIKSKNTGAELLHSPYS